MEHAIEVCQEFQPQPHETAQTLKDYISDLGANVKEFIDRYTLEEIQASGAKIDDSAETAYELQKQEMPGVFREMGQEFQKNICSEMRADILRMSPAVMVDLNSR